MKSDKNVTFDIVQSWLDNVAYSHSKSVHTQTEYRHNINRFCQFIKKTPEQILKEYDAASDREFKRTYAMYVRGLIGSLLQQGFTTSSIKVVVAAIQSFFKYNDLPLGHIPTAKARVVYHNRDIKREEIIEILRIARPRDRAFFCMMAQTGLRPHTMCELRLKHIQPDFDKNVVPCKIQIPENIAKGEYREYFTFMGEESIKHLTDYLKTRSNLTPESYLFTMHGSEEKLDPKSISHRFRDAIMKLKQKGIIEYDQKKEGKPGTVRLYSLRKYFRKFANQAGFEFVQFWMGHIVSKGQEEHYRPNDVEFHRQLYKEKAMPFLRIEEATPSEYDKSLEAMKQNYEKRFKNQEQQIKILQAAIKSQDAIHKEYEEIQKVKKDIEAIKRTQEATQKFILEANEKTAIEFVRSIREEAKKQKQQKT